MDPRVLEEMLPYFTERFGNAASIDHPFGADAAEVVEQSRKRISRCLNAAPEDVIFTSGATESNNIVLQGLANKNPEKDHIVTCLTEHKSVLDTCKYLESIGKKVTYLPVDQQGVINLNELESAISKRTALITIMTANNEIGTLAPIKEIGQIANDHGVPFHTDATQAVGHLPFNVNELNVDLASISAHKIYGPKGVGALYFKSSNFEAKPSSIFFGGGHERGIRSGTLNVPGIVGLASAFELSVKLMKEENLQYQKWFKQLMSLFEEKACPVELNGHPIQRLAHNINVSFAKVENKALIHVVNSKLAISTSSACTTLNVEPSHVILALGVGTDRAHTAIRLGLSRFNTDEEIAYAGDLIVKSVKKLRTLSL